MRRSWLLPLLMVSPLLVAPQGRAQQEAAQTAPLVRNPVQEQGAAEQQQRESLAGGLTHEPIWNNPVMWMQHRRNPVLNDFRSLASRAAIRPANAYALSQREYARTVLHARELFAAGRFTEAAAEYAKAADIDPEGAPYDEWGTRWPPRGTWTGRSESTGKAWTVRRTERQHASGMRFCWWKRGR